MAKKKYIDYKKQQEELFKRTEGYAAQVRAIYQAALGEIIDLVKGTELEDGKSFSFSDYGYSEEVTPILRNMYSKTYQTIRGGVEKEWILANEHNDGLVKSVFGEQSIEDNHFAKYFLRNKEAMDAFFARKTSEEGLNLSQKVWKYTGMYKSELEDALDLAIGEGTPANRLATKIKGYLQDPDRFYRRFRVKIGEDEFGNPVYGRIWKRRIWDKESESYRWVNDDPRKYHPGQGVYRSSYRNAQRLARTETNMAYREADYTRWQQLPFVVGIEIKLSNNHPCADICDDLKGVYPKDFKWTGWHPNCRCYQVPVLAKEADVDKMLDNILDGKEPTENVHPDNEVKKMSPEFGDWINANKDRMEAAREKGTLPYFVRDNEKLVNAALKGDVQGAEPTPLEIAAQRHAARTEADIERIRKAWETRKEAIQTGNSVLSDLSGISDIDTALLQKELNTANYAKALEEAKKLKEYIDELKGLEYVDDGLALAKQYSYGEIVACDNAVKATLQKWANDYGYSSFDKCPLSYQKKKLHFEIYDYYGNNLHGCQQKYTTWQVAESAYGKLLNQVEDKIWWQDITQNVWAEYSKFGKTTSSTIYKNALADLDQAILDGDKQAAQNAISILDKKKASLEKAAANRAAKKSAERNNVLEDFRFDESNFTQARKDKAVWGKSAEEADAHFRGKCEEIWKNATADERAAPHRYTAGSCYLNEPLRGEYYSGGKHAGMFQQDCENLTNMISRSTYDFDYWCQRGDYYALFQKRFGVDLSYYRGDPSKLVGMEGVEKAFLSCGDSKGAGFSGDLTLNIYCPKGTQGLYCEPFSYYGHGVNGNSGMNYDRGLKWDGVTKQTEFGGEAEILLQRGTRFRIIKAEWNENRHRWYIDLEVIGVETKPVK